MSSVPPVTLEDQSAYLLGLIARTKMRDGQTATSSWLALGDADVAMLEGIQQRMARLAPHEGEIRRLVTQRRR